MSCASSAPGSERATIPLPTPGALLEFTTDYSLDIAGRTLALGPAEHRPFQVFLAPIATESPASADGGDAAVELVPGANDRFEISLVSTAGETTEGDAEGPGLEAYAGRWIAQEGNEVVEVGDTPSEVLAALRRRGRTGANWRVPRSREEAESILTSSR